MSYNRGRSYDNDNDKDEFEVINRDEYPFDLSLDPNSQAQLDANGATNLGKMGKSRTPGLGNGRPDFKPNSDHASDIINDESLGLTPILSSMDDPNIESIGSHRHASGHSNADNAKNDHGLENQLVLEPKLYSNLPPLQPLSDPVIPNGLNLQHYNYDGDFGNSFGTGSTVPGGMGAGVGGNRNLVNNPNGQVKKRKDSTGPKTRPAFVMKVWSMVNDPKNHDYIRWDDDGKTFQVYHREEFMKSILPKYFKHNNFASFVRQLNMYGWHKVQDINTGTLKDDKSVEENWKFKNPFFQRDREDLLDNIIRNKPVNQDELNEKSPNLKLILGELESIKLNQLAITEDLRRIRKDNKTLWQENFITRERHSKQAQTLDKILKFLATIYGNNNTGQILEVEDDETHQSLVNQLTANQNGYNAQSPGNAGNITNNFGLEPFNNMNDFSFGEGSDSPKEYQKPRLMLMNQAYRSNKTTPNTNSPDSRSAIEVKTPSDQKDTYGVDGNVGDIFNSPGYGENELINGLEHNIHKQGQSIQQVQDWIQKLSNQQQLQQQQLIQQQEYNQQLQDENRQLHSGSTTSQSTNRNASTSDETSEQNSHPNPKSHNPNAAVPGFPLPLQPKFDIDFDVNDFLHNNSNANTPVNVDDDQQPKRKRFKTENIKELRDDD